MRVRSFLALAVAGLWLVGLPARGDEPHREAGAKAARPTLVARLAPLDQLIGDLRHLVKQIGREEEAKQIEGMLKSRTGPKGLEGVDTRKPIGFYGILEPKLDRSKGVLLLPIADEKTFLAFLDGLNFKTEKGKDGTYTLQVEGVPVPLLFRFADGYLHGTAQLTPNTTLPAVLPRPESVLGDGGSLAALTFHIDQIPPQVRKLAVSSSVLILNGVKDQAMPGATEKQKELRDALVDEAGELITALLEQGTAMRLQLDLDRKADDLAVAFSLAGKPGSKLASGIAGLSAGQSLAATAGPGSAMGGMIHLTLPESLRKAMLPAIDEGIQKALENADANARELVAPLVKALTPTAHAGKFDLSVDVRGPGKKGKYTFVLTTYLEKGRAVEKAFKELLDNIPADARGKLRTDVDKVGEVNIHRLSQDLDANARELFGDVPLFFALRDDALLVSFGEDGQETLKRLVAARPASVQPLRAELALSRMARLMARDEKAAPEMAKKAFKGKGDDRVLLTVRAGERLQVRFSVKTAVLTFASLLDEARKKARDN